MPAYFTSEQLKQKTPRILLLLVRDHFASQVTMSVFCYGDKRD